MSETTRKKVLEMRDLSITFSTTAGPVNAIRGVDLDLYKGETLAIVGESGSGKSVTAKAIMGILDKNSTVNSGRIRFWYNRDDGSEVEVDLAQLSKKEFRQRINGKRIAMVFQDPMTSLDPTMPVGAQIMEGMIWHYKTPKAEARRRAVALLEEVGIPEPKLQPVRIRSGDDVLFKTFAGKGDGHPHGNGVQAVAVADFVSLGDGFQIQDIQIGSQSGHGFVFRPAVARINPILGVIQLDPAFALNRAGIAAQSFFQEDPIVGVAAHRGRIVQLALAEMIDRQAAGGRQQFAEYGGSVMMKTLSERVFFEGPGVIDGGFAQKFRIGKRYFLRTQGGNGPQILGAHQRAEPVSSIEIGEVVGDVGKAHQVHARQPRLGHPDFRAAVFFANGVLDFTGPPSGQVCRIPDFSLAVRHP